MGKYTIIVEKGQDGYLIGEALELPGCHTQAKTLDKLMSRMKEAIELYLEETSRIESGPAPVFVSVQHLEV